MRRPLKSALAEPALPASRGRTTAEVASYYRVGVGKVLAWIRSGQLVAVNTASTLCGRPRWIVTPQALADFEARRQSGPPPQPSRRSKRTAWIDYYP